MNKDDIVKIIEEYNTSHGGTSGGFTVPFHRHNGSDMVQVESGNLAPYTIVSSVDSNQFNTPVNIPQGKISLFDYSQNQVGGLDYYNWGIDIFLGNNGGAVQWSELNLADFYVDAIQTVPQTITAGNKATIIYDNTQGVEKPIGAFYTATGQFKTVKNIQGQTQVYQGWNTPGWYLVTAGVGVKPGAGTIAGESVDIFVVIDGTIQNFARFYFTSTVDIITATISVLLSETINTEIHIELANNSSGNISTNIAGISDITYFKIKQLK